MSIVLTISAQERNVLREELRNDLVGIDELESMASRGLFLQDLLAMRGRLDLGLHLLDDLGWELSDTRAEFHITVEPGRLRRWLRDIRDTRLGALEGAREAIVSGGDVLGADLYSPGAAAVLQDARAEADRSLDALAVVEELIARLR